MFNQRYFPLINQRSKNKHKQLVCDWCLSYVTTDHKKLENHAEDCMGVSAIPQKTALPAPNSKPYMPYKIKNRMLIPYYYSRFWVNFRKERSC